MAFKVQFTNVGRNQTCWIESMPAVNEVTLYKAVKKRGGLASKGIDFDWESKTEGTILVGGFREVGKFHILPDCHYGE